MVLAKNQTAVVVTVHATTQRIAPLVLLIAANAHFVAMARAMAQRIAPLVLKIVGLAPESKLSSRSNVVSMHGRYYTVLFR